MSQIQISLEGTSAIAFAGVLQRVPGLEVSVEVADPVEPMEEGEKMIDRVLVKVTLVSETMDLLSNSVGVMQEFSDFQFQPVKSVVIDFGEGQGLKQMKLENARPEEILVILNAVK
jgi:hypothetical protein